MYTKPDERDFKTTFYERFKKSGVWCPFKVKDFTVKSLNLNLSGKLFYGPEKTLIQIEINR